ELEARAWELTISPQPLAISLWPHCANWCRSITCWTASKLHVPPDPGQRKRANMAQRLDKERNPARSKAAILDAAERLFAEQGYEATSLSAVGMAAGVSRATPGYFFGSKADLYQAVLDRCFAEVREAVRTGRARALSSSRSGDAILAGA